MQKQVQFSMNKTKEAEDVVDDLLRKKKKLEDVPKNKKCCKLTY